MAEARSLLTDDEDPILVSASSAGARKSRSEMIFLLILGVLACSFFAFNFAFPKSNGSRKFDSLTSAEAMGEMLGYGAEAEFEYDFDTDFSLGSSEASETTEEGK